MTDMNAKQTYKRILKNDKDIEKNYRIILDGNFDLWKQTH